MATISAHTNQTNVPTYDYQCRSCGNITEVIHSMLEEGPTTCERCGGELRRVFHPTGIIFKGRGFYTTDSRSASTATRSGSASRDGAGEASASKGEGATGGEAGTGSPPAAASGE
jgi:putative FmdB family regulatory protein